MIGWIENQLHIKNPQYYPTLFKTDINTEEINNYFPQKNSSKDLKNEHTTKELNIAIKSDTWKTFFGSNDFTVTPMEFLKLSPIISIPVEQLMINQNIGIFANLFPLILQRLKMWGVHFIEPHNLAQFGPKTNIFNFNENFSERKKMFETKKVIQNCTKQKIPGSDFFSIPLTRLDILSCILASCDQFVFQDILRIMSQFPIALPLVLQNLRSKGKWTCISSLLKSVSTKWESSPAVVVHNKLFSDSYKMVSAIRIGSSHVGKSTLLNQLFSSRNIFSSSSDPGSENGKPLTLNGCVEICFLTQETASPILWESTLKKHYATGKNELLLLANMHGDALEHPEILKCLKGINSYFVVFFMPMSKSELHEKHVKLQTLLDDFEEVLVDPTEECKQLLDKFVDTKTITSDSTSEIIRSAIRSALQFQENNIIQPATFSVMDFIPEIWTNESHNLIAFVRTHGCYKIKKFLKMQQLNPKETYYHDDVKLIWDSNPNLQTLIYLFISIFKLPHKKLFVALEHLDRSITNQSSEESFLIRRDIILLQEQKLRTLNFKIAPQNNFERELLDDRIKSMFVKLDRLALGMEHFYREIGRMYQIVQSSNNIAFGINKMVLDVVKPCSEMLFQGNAIEILDGDIMDMCGPWFNAICHSICQKQSNLKIFVISIIGLQSSGKSTLLNALFACKFAVSVGRCTRGLFMRILYLEEELVTKLGVNAIVVLDTEGLGAPEKLNDSKSEQKDRLLATFAMSVSNLTLVNVLGESLRDLTDILQIVVVTMARLEKANISPDILMVQHLSERDSSKTMKGKDEFCNALNEAIVLTGEKDMAIGVQNSKSLARLQKRVKSGEILKQFPPFKNGGTINAPPSQQYHENVMDLYEKILQSCRETDNYQTFHQWHEIIQSYWDAVSAQDFALRFKNIKEVQDFIERGFVIARVKESIDEAFQMHREILEKDLRIAVNEKIINGNLKESANWESHEKNELFESMEITLASIPNICESMCQQCQALIILRERLYKDVENKPCEQETQNTIFKYIVKSRQGTIRHLRQMSEALIISQGFSSQHDKIIAKIVQEKLNIKSSYSEEEIAGIITEIWTKVMQQVSQTLKVTPARRRIDNDVEQEYENFGSVPEKFRKGIKPNLSYSKAIKYNKMEKTFHHTQALLDQKQLYALEALIQELPSFILKKKRTNHFSDGMTRILKQDIDNLLVQFEKDHVKLGKLRQNFKWEVHVCALQYFKRFMESRQIEWDKINNPLTILCNKKNAYEEEMGIRLRHGIGFEGEGRVLGDALIRAIRQKGQKAGDLKHISNIKGLSWLTGSENVRLKYFSELATNVERGVKAIALLHFRNPKQMTKWFENQIDSLSDAGGIDMFYKTMDAEYELVNQEIFNKKNCKEILDFSLKYLLEVHGIEFNPIIDFSKTSEMDETVFKSSILKQLKHSKATLRYEMLICKPSKCSDIVDKLGCSESCSWCGALCWGERGHETNDDNTKQHHSCHQPAGLASCHNRKTKCLTVEPCHSFDGWKVYWGKNVKGIPWEVAKLHEDFRGWLFNAHNRSEFSDLMKWFFNKLHKDIAAERGLNPGTNMELVTHGFNSLPNLSHILLIIKTKIGD